MTIVARDSVRPGKRSVDLSEVPSMVRLGLTITRIIDLRRACTADRGLGVSPIAHRLLAKPSPYQLEQLSDVVTDDTRDFGGSLLGQPSPTISHEIHSAAPA